MSEKRFVCIDVGYGDDWYITDNGKRLSEMEIVGLLNEQQAIIEHLKGDKAIAEDYANIFEKENVKLRKQIDEQQATINKQERKIRKCEAEVGRQLKQIIELQDELKEKEEDEKLDANEIVKLNKEAKEVLDFKSVGGNY